MAADHRVGGGQRVANRYHKLAYGGNLGSDAALHELDGSTLTTTLPILPPISTYR
jgi:hypothetical protein